MATADLSIEETGRESRLATLARIAGLKRGGAKYFTLDRVLVLLSFLLLPAGIGAIVLGWLGAAHTPFLFEQIPYLISGGLLGVGLLIVSGLIYVGSWIARLAEQERTDAAQVRELIAALREDLQRVPGLAVDAVSRAEAGQPVRVVATPTGRMFHRPDCAVVATRDDLREVDPTDPKLKPCGMCEPLAG